jgi:hypothetical protein
MSTIPIEFPEESTGSEEPVVSNVPQEVNEPIEEVYSILEEGPFPLLDLQDPSKVLAIHEELIKTRISSCMHLENEEELKIENLAATYFGGTNPDEQDVALYRNGMSISLWDVNGKLALVATSDCVSLVLAIKRKDAQIDMLNYELSYEKYHDPTSSWIEISHKANQDVEKTLRDWATYHKAKKTGETSKLYNRLIGFKIDAMKTDHRWGWVWRLKSPLLFLAHCTLRRHYTKRIMFDKNPLVEWMSENVILPEFKSSGD